MTQAPQQPASPNGPSGRVRPAPSAPGSARAEAPGTGLLGWIKRAAATGAAVSVLLHLILTGFAAAVSVSYEGADAGGGVGAEVEFAIISQTELAALSSPEIESTESPVEIESVSDAAPLIEAQTPDTISLQAERLELEPASGGAGGPSDPGGGFEGLEGAGAGGGASFFGVEAQGRRFAYIVDRSGSMSQDTGNGLSKMYLTQRALDRSIDGLLENAEFSVVLYSTTPSPLGRKRGWTPATAANKLWARRRIYMVDADGGTHPEKAFRQVFKARPYPDAIYFMTDGVFGPGVPDEIARLNEGPRVPIHCIMFGDFSDSDSIDVERMMRRMAQESGGSFARVRGATP